MSIYLVNILNIKNATQLGGVNKRQKIGCHFPGKIHHQTLKIFGIESRPREKKNGMFQLPSWMKKYFWIPKFEVHGNFEEERALQGPFWGNEKSFHWGNVWRTKADPVPMLPNLLSLTQKLRTNTQKWRQFWECHNVFDQCGHCYKTFSIHVIKSLSA